MKDYVPVSVVIPCYCSDKTIARAVNSVLKQTVLPKELILIDDCSPDNHKTLNVLKTIKEKYNNILKIIIIECAINQGPGSARNRGIEKSTQPYIAFLDADDIWHPQKIEIQYGIMSNDETIFFSCHEGNIITIDKVEYFYKFVVSRRKVKYRIINPIHLLFRHASKGGSNSVMVKKVGKLNFKEGQRYSEDYFLWLKYNFKFKGIVINSILSATLKPLYGSTGLSSSLWKIEKGELQNYNSLRKERYISLLIQICASVFSFLKYVRRVIITKTR